MLVTEKEVQGKVKEYLNCITKTRIQKYELAAIDDFLFWSR